MAEQVHGYIKTAIVVAAIVFSGGGYAMKIHGNSAAIAHGRSVDDKLEEENRAIVERIHTIEINQAEKIATDKATLDTLIELKSGVEAIHKNQVKMQMDINTTNTRMEFITKESIDGEN
jgi:hypothetical protein